MTNWLDEFNDLKLPPLSRGRHADPDEGLCAMEMVAFMERLEHTDAPTCTCPVIASFVRKFNDWLADADRDRLLAYLPRLVGTVSPEHELRRMTVVLVAMERLVAQWACSLADMTLQESRLRSHVAMAYLAERLGDPAKAANQACSVIMIGREHELGFEVLDQLLAIGPQGRWSAPIEERVRELENLYA